MVVINNLTPRQDGTQIEYTVNFQGTNHNISGSFVSESDEFATAFKQVINGDVFGGIKNLVLTRLQTEAQNALNAENTTH